MSDTDGPAGQELCVLYREAIYWIAFRNFWGRAVGIGPRPLEKLPRFGYDDDDDDVEYGIDIGRSILAQELLLDYAAKRRIRVYANEGSTENEASLSFPIQLTAEFLAKAEFDFDECEGPTLFIREDKAIMNWLFIMVICSESFGGTRPRSRFQKRLRALLPTSRRSPPTRLTCAPAKLMPLRAP